MNIKISRLILFSLFLQTSSCFAAVPAENSDKSPTVASEKQNSLLKSFTKRLEPQPAESIMAMFAGIGGFQESRKKEMIQDLEVIKHNFQAGYAPLEWKKDHVGFDLDRAFEDVKREILEAPTLTTKQFHGIVRKFVCSLQDHHVDAIFFSTESAELPFSIRGAEGRYFIDWIDPVRLSPSHYPVRVGDELLHFDERPIADVINELVKDCSKQVNPKTDLRMAELKLTQRRGMAGDLVPRGAVMISTRSATTGKVDSYQLHWSYTPEQIASPFDFLDSLNFISEFLSPQQKKPELELPKIVMSNPLHEAYALHSLERERGLGSFKSCVPDLGEIIWTYEKHPDEASGGRPTWNAYVYRHPNGRSVGYIRIPHYHESQPMVEEFGELINLLEEKTDALVIDQLHNFGGRVDYLYELLSILALEPLKAPHHRIKISQKEVMGAYTNLELIKLIELLITSQEFERKEPEKKEDEQHEEMQDQPEAQDEDNDGARVDEHEDVGINYQELMFLRSYYELIVDEWSRGATITRPTPIMGVDRINPHPKYRYTKPLLILIDEMDFSGGDFMPAIIQDNQRGLLFGSRTAGAGGFVTSFDFPNSNGIALCTYTGSIAERSNLQKIEDLGVSPDIAYELTADDIRSGYQGYVQAVNQAVQKMLEGS